MTISMYQASVPVFVKGLKAMSGVLAKGKAHVEARKIDEAAFMQGRLYPDMLPFTRQVFIATDMAKGCAARLAGVDVPVYEDTETTFEGLIARVAKTVAFIDGLTPAQVDGTEDKDITLMRGGQPLVVKGQTYLLEQAVPNFYFHLTTTYALLRQGGVEIGKKDFLGAV
jgi:hypothetical protein